MGFPTPFFYVEATFGGEATYCLALYAGAILLRVFDAVRFKLELGPRNEHAPDRWRRETRMMWQIEGIVLLSVLVQLMMTALVVPRIVLLGGGRDLLLVVFVVALGILTGSGMMVIFEYSKTVRNRVEEKKEKEEEDVDVDVEAKMK
jgi:hypothetical protein